MEVDADRLALPAIDTANPGGGIAVRQQSQVAASANREDLAGRQFYSGGRHFADGSRCGLHNVRLAIGSWNAVPVVGDRENTGIVGKAELRQDVQSPQRIPGNRVAWRAVDARNHSARIADGFDR